MARRDAPGLRGQERDREPALLWNYLVPVPAAQPVMMSMPALRDRVLSAGSNPVADKHATSARKA